MLGYAVAQFELPAKAVVVNAVQEALKTSLPKKTPYFIFLTLFAFHAKITKRFLNFWEQRYFYFTRLADRFQSEFGAFDAALTAGQRVNI